MQGGVFSRMGTFLRGGLPSRFRRFFMSYLMVAIPVLLATNLIFYWLFVPAYQSEVEQMNTDAFVSVQTAFDHYVYQPIDRYYLDLVLRDSTGAALYPLSHPQRDDLWKLFQAHQSMKSMVESDSLLNQVGIYYYESHFINSSAGFLETSDHDSLIYPDWADMLQFEGGSRWLEHVETKHYSRQMATVNDVVYYFRNFPLDAGSDRRKMTVVFSLHKSYLIDLLTTQTGFDRYGFTLITSDGDVLLSNLETPFDKSSLPAAVFDHAGVQAQVRRVGDQMLTVIPSSRQDLLFIFSIPRSYYFKQTDQIKIQILMLVSVALLMILMGSSVISRIMYRPIQKINQTANSAMDAIGEKTDHGDGDDYVNIHHALETLSSHVQDLSGTLETIRPRLRTNLYRDLLYSHQRSNAAIEERMSTLGIAPRACHQVFVLRVLRSPGDMTLTELFKVKLMELIRSWQSSDFEVFTTLHEESDMIAAASYDDPDRMRQLLDAVSSHLWQEGQPAFLLAVGEVKDDILELRESLQTAQIALRYGFLFPRKVLYYTDFKEWEDAQTVLACANSDRLFALVKDLSTPQAQTKAEAFIAELHEQLYEQPYAYRYLQFALQNIQMTLIEIGKKQGLYADRLLEGELVNRDAHVGTIDEYEAVLADLLADLSSRFTLKRSNANYDTVMMVQQYVQEHLHEELSLSIVAKQFHISYSHMSKVFKEISGMNFTEYVLQCRLNESIHYLLHTDLNLDAIAEKIAIFNTGYYIRTFKAKYGVTPKQYRLTNAPQQT